MGDVIDLRPTPHDDETKEEIVKVWSCECGCRLFYLCEDGMLLCSTCMGAVKDGLHNIGGNGHTA